MISDLLFHGIFHMITQILILAFLFALLIGCTWYKPIRTDLTKRDVGWLGFRASHEHYKGGRYEEMTRATATDRIEPGEAVVVYVHETGSTYVRPARLFDQPWRFEVLEK